MKSCTACRNYFSAHKFIISLVGFIFVSLFQVDAITLVFGRLVSHGIMSNASGWWLESTCLSLSSHCWHHIILSTMVQEWISTDILLLQFYLEEVKGRVDYQGYIYPRRRGQVVSDEWSDFVFNLATVAWYNITMLKLLRS